MKDLRFVSTKELVEELKIREGVKVTEAFPYTATVIKTEGPTIILEIID